MSQIQTTDCCSRMENRPVDRIYHHLSESGASLAMGYIPEQKWDHTYELCKGLRAGTIFPCLNKPFCGKGGKCR